MEMAGLFQEAKDILEATQFYSGAGTTSFPQGIRTGLTNTQRVQTATTAVFVVGDLYALQNALPPRARNGGSQFIASLNQLNRVRALDTSGGSSLWVQLGNGLPGQLIGMEAYELSTMPTALTTTTDLMVVGDFSSGYLIVDRIGMEVELIPHLFGASNRFPTGQRGLWAFWRNSAKVLDPNRFRFLQVL
jgi:HK97 family phage major capsid protein